MDRRQFNAEIFKDTEKLCRSNEKLKRAIQYSYENQRIYHEKDVITEKIKEKNTEDLTKILVSKKRSLEAASAYQGKKICVHNFASATNPGGGVVHGSSAQEECLCRCSTLYFSLNTKNAWENFYTPHREMNNPIYNGDCIYTPEVIVFKEDTANPQLMKKEDWYSVDVITMAAPNLRKKPSNLMNPNAGEKQIQLTSQELLDIHINRARRFFEVAKANGNEVLILGAFGCGAFQNSPEVVAEAYKKVLAEYEGVFETIEFAVYCSPKDTSNYECFKRKIMGYVAKR